MGQSIPCGSHKPVCGGGWKFLWLCFLGATGVRGKGREVVRHKIANTMFPLIAFFAIISGFVLLWSYYVDIMFPPIEYGPNKGYVKPVEARPGDFVNLCRDMTFNRKIEFDISRSLTSSAYDGIVLTVEMDSTRVIRMPGHLSQCRIVQIPYGIPPGEWTLHTWTSYTSWPFWNRKEESPDVKVTVLD